MKKEVKQIIIKTKKQVFGSLNGVHFTTLQGEGFEFSELREYAYGDDIRKIDWKTTAKMGGKPFVKVYHEERELNVVISTLLSGSTYFGTKMPKSKFMIEIMATLGFSAIKNRDLFSHILFADKLYRVSKPSKSIYAVDKEVEEAINFDVLGKGANPTGWVDELSKRVRKKSVLILISDFVGDYNLRLLAKKHDLILIMVRDYFIENPKPMGEVRLVDPGHLDSFRGNVDESTIKAYVDALRDNDIKLYKHLKNIGARFLKIYTHQNQFLELAKRL